MSYTVKLEIFEGPLDLLLHLIKENSIDIYDIPIAKITEQYLEYLELIRLLDLNVAGEFLVMASTLMHIKSEMLLPEEERQPEEKEEEDPRADLVKKLTEYKRFKELSEQMRMMELSQQKIFIRKAAAPDLINEAVQEEEQASGFEANIFDLLSAFSRVIKEIPKEVFYEIVKDEWTVEGKSKHIMFLLKTKSSIYFGELFLNAKNKLEIITIFLAILEMVRRKYIIAIQEKPFGDIAIKRYNAE